MFILYLIYGLLDDDVDKYFFVIDEKRGQIQIIIKAYTKHDRVQFVQYFSYFFKKIFIY